MLKSKLKWEQPSPPNSEICFGSLQKETLDSLGWVPLICVHFVEFNLIQEHFQGPQSSSGYLSFKVNVWGGYSVGCGRRLEGGFHKSRIISVPSFHC